MFSLADDGGRFHSSIAMGKRCSLRKRRGTGKGETSLYVGAPSVRMTDYQGNETQLATHDGVAQLPHAELPYFIEGADLEVLKANLVPSLVAAASDGDGSI